METAMADDDLDYQDDDFEEETEDSVEDAEDEEGAGTGSSTSSRARTESAEELAEAAASAHSALAARNKMREAMQSKWRLSSLVVARSNKSTTTSWRIHPKKPSSNYGSQPI